MATVAAVSMDQAPPPGPSTALHRASLYVGDLHPDVIEADLIQLFGTMGALDSVRVCRDRVSRKSLCYAYVNFLNPSDATRALASLNHRKLREKSMRIMWCQRDPLARKNGVANLYVKNLDPSVNSAHLEEMFGKYGTILSCKVAEENGKSKGFGFVQFDSEDAATTALNALNDTMFEGKKLCVCKFIRKSERNDASEKTFTNLYFKNLDENVTVDFLKEKFSEHGTVCNIVIMKDDEGKSRGFGFVKFSLHEEAKKAVECLNGAVLGSKNLYVGRAQKKAEREQILKQAHEFMLDNNYAKSNASNLFVKNLNLSFDDLELEELFGAYGKVTSAKVIYNEDGVSKGFGFVCFSCPEEARRALDSLNGSTVRGMVLYVALAHCRKEHLRQLQSIDTKQSFHTPFWNIHVPQYYPLYHNAPPFSIPHFRPFQPRLYQSFCRSLSGFFPSEDQRLQGKFCTHLQFPIQQPQQEPIKDMAHQYHPKKHSTAYGSTQPLNIGSVKQQKPSSKLGNKTVYGPLETSRTGPGSVNSPFIDSKHDLEFGALKQKKPSCKLGKMSTCAAIGTSTTGSRSVSSAARTSSQWVYKKNCRTMLQPLDKNSQELLESQNPLALHMEKAVQMIKANSGSVSHSNTSILPAGQS